MNRQKLVFLTAAILAALAVGIWLFVAPGLHKQKLLREQDRLMDSITAGDGVIVLDTGAASGDVDFYDEPDTEPAPEPAAPAPGAMPEASGDPASATAEPEQEAPDAPVTIEGTGILTIETIGLKLPVVDGVTKAQLQVAVGRVPETAEIGATGNAVIAGHRSYTYGDYFNRLGEVESGDIIGYTDRTGAAMRFEVYEILTVEPGYQSAFTQDTDGAEITLLTCTPIRTATHRLLVRAKRIA
jgi:sortase A